MGETLPWLRDLDERIAGCRTYVFAPDVPPSDCWHVDGGPVAFIEIPDGRKLKFDPPNVLFPPGGSLIWMEDIDTDLPVLCCAYVGEPGLYRKYALRCEEEAGRG